MLALQMNFPKRVESVERNKNVDLSATISLEEVFQVLWRQRARIVLNTCGLAAILGAVVTLMPNKYDSDAQLLVRLGRGTLSTDPTNNITPAISVQETRLSQVISVKEMFASRALAEQVVQRVGAERILAPHGLVETLIHRLTSWIPTGSGSSDSEQPASAEELGQLSPAATAEHIRQEEAILKVQQNLELIPAKNAYTIYARIRSGSPYLSQELLTALIELYQQYHIDAHHSDRTLPFFESQTAEAYEAAVRTRDRVRQVKDEKGIIELEGSRVALREQLSKTRQDLAQVEAELAAATSEVERYERELEKMPQRVESETLTGITSATGDGMRQQLYLLEMQAKELSSKLREDHPQVRAIRDQLAAASRIAEQERKEQPQHRQVINPVFQQLELAYNTGSAVRDGLRAKRDSLHSQLQQLQSEIAGLNQSDLELTKLTWEAILAENMYLQNAQNRDKSRILDALDREGLSEISVVQPASLQLKKASPKRGLLIAAAALVALSLSTLIALVRGIAALPSSANRPIESSLDDGRQWDARPTTSGPQPALPLAEEPELARRPK